MAVLSDTDTKYAKSTWKKRGEKKKKKNKEKCLSLQPCLTNASNLIRHAERTKRHPTQLTETEKTLNLDMKDACNCALVHLLNQKVQRDC